MAIAVATTRQALADAYKNVAGSNSVYISVHIADPGTSGNNEASGGSPAYARKQSTWTSGTGGVITGSQVTIDLPAGSYTHVGLWKTAAGGTADFIDKVAISATTLGAQGQLLITPTFTQS
ncbi:phage tail fiber protein [Nocardia asteroides]|uniref:phage tail fiber protein n=1 Tax=Nocardia asteroides TaxID=1824 RepID=UPI0034236D57